MRRLWVAALALLLAACGAGSETVSCAPCAGPGFVATGLPTTIEDGTLIICVGDEPCTRTKLSGPILPKSQQLVDLADPGPGWQQYDGTSVRVTVVSDRHRWQGSGDLRFREGGDAACSCSSLLAEVAFSPLG